MDLIPDSPSVHDKVAQEAVVPGSIIDCRLTGTFHLTCLSFLRNAAPIRTRGEQAASVSSRPAVTTSSGLSSADTCITATPPPPARGRASPPSFHPMKPAVRVRKQQPAIRLAGGVFSALSVSRPRSGETPLPALSVCVCWRASSLLSFASTHSLNHPNQPSRFSSPSFISKSKSSSTTSSPIHTLASPGLSFLSSYQKRTNAFPPK